MKRITKKLHKEFGKKFLPIAEKLRQEGSPDYEIKKALLDYIKHESIKFYRKLREPQVIGEILKEPMLSTFGGNADSKIEIIYFDLLQENKIPFEFQYKIGPYRADFLIDGWLVFEIDGPLHNKATDLTRDKHMENLGYKVLRVPAWLAAVSHKSVLDEIQEVVKIVKGI